MASMESLTPGLGFRLFLHPYFMDIIPCLSLVSAMPAAQCASGVCWGRGGIAWKGFKSIVLYYNTEDKSRGYLCFVGTPFLFLYCSEILLRLGFSSFEDFCMP